VTEDISAPIIGFYVKDKLGQILFGDNTYFSYRHDSVSVKQGQALQARFSFRMPVLKIGDYSISAAIAEGEQEEPIQHHWVHDALAFKAQSTSLCFGLFGVAMKDIELRVLDA
jgi:lipopolysaccharide transport system ATP-binding protein